jgi:hypothetical protein
MAWAGSWEHAKHKLIWHGLWPTFSAHPQVPDRQVTFLLLSNCDGVSMPFGLGNGNVELARQYFPPPLRV